jgi:hypothetical protein
MKTISVLLGVFALSATMIAQSSIPVGTVIPVELNTTVDVNKCKPGQAISARVAQDVLLDNGTKIKAGSRVVGEVMAATPAGNSQPATVTLRFDKVNISGKVMPVVTSLRALASPLDVDAAQTQISGDDRGSTPPWSQTVTLVGGDVAYREEGMVESGGQTVGHAVYAGNWGVLSQVAANPEGRCRGTVASNDRPQALWVFSHDACGVYGYDARVEHAGRGNSDGKIVIASSSGGLKLRGGSALLLRVNATSEASQSEVVSK